MKCIKEKETGLIVRVTDEVAEGKTRNKNSSFTYASKAEWKKAGREFAVGTSSGVKPAVRSAARKASKQALEEARLRAKIAKALAEMS